MIIVFFVSFVKQCSLITDAFLQEGTKGHLRQLARSSRSFIGGGEKSVWEQACTTRYRDRWNV